MAITEIEDKISEIIKKDDHSNFIYDFLGVYDIPKATITKLKKGINNLSKEEGEVYLKNKLYYKETAKDLMQAFTDVKAKVDELGTKPRYIFVTDFKEILAYDTKTEDTLSIPFKRLPQKFEFFLAWNGIEKADFDKENPADIRAAERFAKLYDIVVKDNPNATRNGLNLFLIRVLFCLFAEDTEIFEKNLFTNRLKQMTQSDGSDLDEFISQLFSVLDVKKEDRPTDTPSWLDDFPYVDGDLFKDPHESLKFTVKSRKLIIDAGEKLEWNQINPDILGSMLQAVASEDNRSHLGMHYTSVPNIMKVIKPLFLDDLREEFKKDKGNYKKLQQLYNRIGKIKFMDPACGSGNFLIVTYKQLRQLEIDILKEQNRILTEEGTGKAMMYLPSVTLDQFYGIEIDDFACDTTRLSLWIAEHQMNIKLREEINNAVRPTLPLQHAGAIVCGNALRLDWEKILPHKKDDEVYLFGNPPYSGSAKQDAQQKLDMYDFFNKRLKKYKKLDYITAWFFKGTDYIYNTKAQLSFVSTNSICEGEQVPILWPKILKKVVINFAYTSFVWSNNAKNNAGVAVIIIGLGAIPKKHKYLYSKASYEQVINISPYLTAGENIIVHKSIKPINNLPIMLKGSSPIDKGNFIIAGDQLGSLTNFERKHLKKFIGSNELANGKKRYCLWLYQVAPEEYANEDDLNKRIHSVYNFRIKSKRKATQRDAKYPELFGEVRWKKQPAIIVPRVTTSSRIYIPIGFVGDDTVISDSAMEIYDAPIWLLGLLESRMHMTWLKAICGRLGAEGLRYSAGLVYNTFPVPELSVEIKNEVEKLVLIILDIREEEGGTLAELYGSPLAKKNPKPMNSRLLKAHQKLDEVIDQAYKPNGFQDDNERLAVLLDMYSKKLKKNNE